ncbi:MAG: CTP synthase [Candidatus Pacebacteria bacterium]|nr:CTP synthase [Candidatus Paceibacterota bacterium]
MRKYIFVTGGVMSGVGKGIASSSIAKILQAKGFKTTAIKIDPYINVDAGTMNPTEHGEVFVLCDGDETDQDMGNYERFLNMDLTRINYMTTGRVYEEVIRKERNLEYKGKNVEVVPDIPREVNRRIKKAAEEADADITLIEIGGTIGEYQNIIFLEAARMMKSKNPEDVAFVMVSYLPIPSKVGEMKTKPTQTAARMLNSVGVQADVIIARSDIVLDKKRKEKIATFCNIKADHVISAPDVESIYDVPINFEKDNLGDILCGVLSVKPKHKTDLKDWKKFVKSSKNGHKKVKIGVVGKYFDSGDFVLSDVYISVLEAIKYSCYKNKVSPEIDYINSKDIESGKLSVSILKKYDGILVPGGFGETGIEGIIKAIKYARENKIPYFGLCYGMQLLVLEFARNVAGIKDAHTAEIKPGSKNPVIDIMLEQKKLMEKKDYGGTMRLGSYKAVLKKGTIARSAYGKLEVEERHRHRFEVNPEYIAKLSDAGLVFSGTSPDHRLMEIAELPKNVHPFFLGTQFHPEFRARPLSPHPLFNAFIKSLVK